MNNKFSKITAGIMLGSMLLYTAPVQAFTKDETVYSNVKANGENYQTVVTEHLKNTKGEEVLKDLTDLLEIENTSGDEQFKQENETLIWEAKSNDIYYKGKSQKALPIEINVKYQLDGKDISPEELAGKSGRVKIIIQYKNKEEHQVKINDNDVTMYTPFVVACGTFIKNENAKNVEVKNGKAIDDGSKTMIAGLAFPGMQESLGINKDKINIPDTVEITFDATDFEMNNIINYITPKVFDDSNLDIFGRLDEIYSKVDKLQSASKTIEDGAKTLSDGTKEYSSKSKEFNNAVGQFSTGMSNANNSYKELNSGIATLNSSSTALQNGSKQVSAGIAAVDGGVEQMQQGLANSSSSMAQLTTGSKQVAGGLQQLQQKLPTVAQNIKAQKQYNTGVINTLNSQITTLTSQKSDLQSALTIDAIAGSDSAKNAISNEIKNIDTQIAQNTAMITNLTTENAYLDGIAGTFTSDTTDPSNPTIKSSVEALTNGATQVSGGVETLASSVGQLSDGLNTLKTNTSKLATGAKQVSDGTSQLKAGASKLEAGSNKMQDGLTTLDQSSQKILDADNKLVEAADSISQGATKLADGMSEFNGTAINPICNYINGDVRNVADRAEKLKGLSDYYKSFTKVNDNDEGKTKFIVIVDSIKKEDSKNKGQEKIDEKSGE